MRLSYSKLSDLEVCEKKFFLSHIKFVPTVANKFMKAGIEVHDILYESTKRINWKQYIFSNPKYYEFKEMLDNYIDYQDRLIASGGSSMPLHAELKLFDPKFNFSLKIDRVDKGARDRVLISDYKSDASPDYKKHRRQLLIYAFFYNRLMKERVTHIAPLFLKKPIKLRASKIVTREMDEAIFWIKKGMKKVDDKGKSEDKYEAKPSPLCLYCTHYELNYCKIGRAYMDNPKTANEVKDLNIEM
jgi:hypothetical protein